MAHAPKRLRFERLEDRTAPARLVLESGGFGFDTYLDSNGDTTRTRQPVGVSLVSSSYSERWGYTARPGQESWTDLTIRNSDATLGLFPDVNITDERIIEIDPYTNLSVENPGRYYSVTQSGSIASTSNAELGTPIVVRILPDEGEQVGDPVRIHVAAETPGDLSDIPQGMQVDAVSEVYIRTSDGIRTLIQNRFRSPASAPPTGQVNEAFAARIGDRFELGFSANSIFDWRYSGGEYDFRTYYRLVAGVAVEPLAGEGLSYIDQAKKLTAKIIAKDADKQAKRYFMLAIAPGPIPPHVRGYYLATATFWKGLSLAYGKIADDPPDLNYTTFAQLSPVARPSLPANGLTDELVQATTAFTQTASEFASVGNAFIASVEKASGAAIDGNREWLLRQSNAVRMWSDQLASLSDKLQRQSRPLADALQAAGLDRTLTESELTATRDRLRSDGLTSDIRELGLDAGLTPNDLDRLVTSILDSVPREVVGSPLTTIRSNDWQQSLQSFARGFRDVGFGPVYAIGADAGGGPLVRLIDAQSGEEKRSFLAYDAGVRSGVRVAVGDVTGDGVPDVVTGPGTGVASHVRVFDGVSGEPVYDTFAYDPSFVGGIYVATGDIDGDGVDEIIIGAGTGGGPHIRAINARTGEVLANFFAYDPSFRGGVVVAAADVNGDGRVDLVTAAGPGGGPHIQAFDGQTAELLVNFFAYDPSLRQGVFVAAGDVDGDGQSDLITGAGPTGAPHVRAFRGRAMEPILDFFAFDVNLRGGVRVATQDLDLDGKDDILATTGPGGGPFVRGFRGSTGEMLSEQLLLDGSFRGGLTIGAD